MKRTFKSIMFVAAAAMAFTACNIEPVETPEVTTGTHTVKFIASQVDTKTTMEINDNIASFDWEEADVDYFHIFENEYSYKATDYAADIDENGAMQLMATFENGGTAPFTYFGFFAPTFFTYPQVPAAQTDNGKYDPMADILIAKPVTAESSQNEEILSFQFKRIVAINVMTLKGLTAGEIVSEVKIVSDKPIAGKYDYTKDEWYNSTDTQITVSANSTANEAGQAVVYFVSAPVEAAQLTITATTTEGKTYSKELAKTITFAEGGVRAFGVTVEEDVPVSYGYVKVTSAPADWSGEYLIADGNKVFNGLDAANDFVEGTISNNVLEYNDRMAKIAIEKMEGGYSLKILNGDKADNYISGKSGSNSIVYGATAVANEITFGDDGLVTILSNSTSFRYNATSDQNRFRYYKTTTTGASYHVPALYRYQEIVPIEEVHVTSVSIDGTLNLEVGDTYTLVANVLPENATNKSVTWESNDEDVVTVEGGVVTAVGVGEATITVTTVDGEFTAICDVTVNAAAVKVYSSLADLIAAGEPTTEGKPVTVTLTDEVIESIFVTSQGYRNGVFLKVPETDKKIEIYSRDVPAEWEAFGKISGTLENCTWKKFNNTTWELCPENWEELDYTAPVKYNVVLPTGLVGGTVSADIIEAAAGATITLTATPSTGYQFASWSVKDASDNDVTVTDNAFTMPASDVTVSATFEQSEGGEGGNVPIKLTFDFISNPGGWPTANSTTLTNYTYTLNGTDYSFGLKNVKCNSGYLMLTQPAALGLPAIEGYKLTNVNASNSGGCSTSVKVGVSSSASSADYITGGAAQTWSTTSSTYTYNLSDTSDNTVYYLYVTSKNAQITSLELTYTSVN